MKSINDDVNKNNSIISDIICPKCKCRFNDIFRNFRLSLTYNCYCDKLSIKENINSYLERNRGNKIQIEQRGRGRGRGKVGWNRALTRGIIRENRYQKKRTINLRRKIYFHDLYNPLKKFHISDLYNKLQFKNNNLNDDIIDEEPNYTILKQAKKLINIIIQTFFSSESNLILHNTNKKIFIYDGPFFLENYLSQLETKIKNLKHPYLNDKVLDTIKTFILDINASILIIKKNSNYKINLKISENIRRNLLEYFKEITKFREAINNSFNDGYGNQSISNNIYQVHYIKEKFLLLLVLNKEIRICHKYDFQGNNCLCSTKADIHDSKILKINYELFLVFYSHSIAFLKIEYDNMGIPSKVTFPDDLINNDIEKLNNGVMVDADIIDENNILFIGKNNKIFFLKKN